MQQTRNDKILKLLTNFETNKNFPIVVDEDNNIYKGKNEAFINLIAYLYNNPNEKKTQLDMFEGIKLYIADNKIDYNITTLDDEDFSQEQTEELNNLIATDDFSQNETINTLGKYIFFTFMQDRYKLSENLSDEPTSELLKEYIDENIQEIKNLAQDNNLFDVVYAVAKKIEILDEIYKYKNESKMSNLHELDLFKFEIPKFERFASKIDVVDKTFSSNGKEISYQEKTLYVDDEKIKQNPILQKILDRKLMYFYAFPENSDLNELTGGVNSNFAFKNDEDTKISIKSGKYSKDYKLYKYDKANGAYYTYADILDANYMQMQGYIGDDKNSRDEFERQVSSLKSKWLKLAVSTPSIEEQRIQLYGSDYFQKGNRLYTEGNRNKTHIQTNENKPFFNLNAGLFSAEIGFVEYDFKSAKSIVIKDYSTIACLNMQGFGDNSPIIKKDFIADVEIKAKRLQEQLEKERLREIELEKQHVEISKQITKEYNLMPNNKNEFLHPYFEDHGLDNTTINAIMKFQEVDLYAPNQEKSKTLAIVVPYFSIDNENNLRLYTLETIRYQKLEDNSMYKKKLKTKDARAKGAFGVTGVNNYNALVNALQNSKSIYIAEGFATAMAVNKLTNEICLASGSIHNFISVAKNLLKINNNLELKLCLDNDCLKNPSGLANPMNFINMQVKENEFPSNTKIIVPLFSSHEKGSDWADKLVYKGFEKAKEEFHSSVLSTNEFLDEFHKIIIPLQEDNTLKSDNTL